MVSEHFHKVVLNDHNYDDTTMVTRIEDAHEWARTYCKSFKKVDVVDVSDFSLTSNLVATFSFTSDLDAMMFKLQWA